MTERQIPPYNTLANYLRDKFGQRVQKIPLDAGFTCPNRDGVISSHGCTFCNPEGSGTGMLAEGLNLAAQWKHWLELLETRRQKPTLFLAYLQSYSNTYGPISRIRQVLGELEGLPGLVGLSMGTRPDCVDQDKLDLIAAFPAQEIQLELGLQTSNNDTLKRINRGHDAACFARAAEMAAERGIKVVVHLIAGLPGEGEKEFLDSVDFVSRLPIHGVKMQNLYVCKNTALAQQFESGGYTPLTMDNYTSMAANALTRLRSDVVVHRLNGDPNEEELLAPAWAREKQATLVAIQTTLERQGHSQGCSYTTSES